MEVVDLTLFRNSQGRAGSGLSSVQARQSQTKVEHQTNTEILKRGERIWHRT